MHSEVFESWASREEQGFPFVLVIFTVSVSVWTAPVVWTTVEITDYHSSFTEWSSARERKVPIWRTLGILGPGAAFMASRVHAVGLCLLIDPSDRC